MPDGRTVAVWMSSNRLHIPGGTLEADEAWAEGGRRELIEEIGAEARSLELFGAIVSEDRVRLIAWAEIDDVGAAAEPDMSGTFVVEPRVAPPDEMYSSAMTRVLLASLYRLAIAVRANG
jgi:8-oxo-dGTP pyrophosphatase MutT (NUDIX family)